MSAPAETASDDVWFEIVRRLNNPIPIRLASKALNTVINLVCTTIILTYEQQSRLKDDHIRHLPRGLLSLRGSQTPRRPRPNTHLTHLCLAHLPPLLQELHMPEPFLALWSMPSLHARYYVFFQGLLHLHIPGVHIYDEGALPRGLLSLHVASFRLLDLGSLPRTLVELRGAWQLYHPTQPKPNPTDATLSGLPPSLTSVAFGHKDCTIHTLSNFCGGHGWLPAAAHLKRHFSGLLRLDIYNDTQQSIDDAFVAALPPSLTRLRVHHCALLTDAAVQLLPRTLTHLHLGDGRADGLTNACAADFPPSLTTLRLENFSAMTSSSIPLFPRSITSLSVTIVVADTFFYRLPRGLLHLSLSTLGFSPTTATCLPPGLLSLDILPTNPNQININPNPNPFSDEAMAALPHTTRLQFYEWCK